MGKFRKITERDEEWYNDAVKRLKQYCENNDVEYQEPCKELSLISGRLVHFSYKKGPFAIYVIRSKRFLAPVLTLLR